MAGAAPTAVATSKKGFLPTESLQLPTIGLCINALRLLVPTSVKEDPCINKNFDTR